MFVNQVNLESESESESENGAVVCGRVQARNRTTL